VEINSEAESVQNKLQTVFKPDFTTTDNINQHPTVLTLTRVTTRHTMKFPDGSWHSSAALGMLSVTHIMPV